MKNTADNLNTARGGHRTRGATHLTRFVAIASSPARQLGARKDVPRGPTGPARLRKQQPSALVLW